jgi:hypothetical protein
MERFAGRAPKPSSEVPYRALRYSVGKTVNFDDNSLIYVQVDIIFASYYPADMKEQYLEYR